ncbi:hypothetical protein [Corynebacterium sp. HMSC29G08]|uniref:hypothetical protein n=1 Tax=Corynebacterium sp. HMSC29G08 TaxID=1581069 RepID=UPI0008A29C2B|nr:hypothetical protein [Corynebacterium sp. HMSC29G08]OFT82368.1 hypothetical protein HMPREF3101_07750 [Corynebacterium sp. HMSC29G08]
MLKKTLVTLVGAALMLSACVPSGKIESLGGAAETESEVETVEPGVDPVESEVESSEPRGFVFDSGFLEFGDFDPYALGDDLFNPCTEITLEEYAAAGFPGVDITVESRPNSALKSCYIQGTDEQLDRAIATGFDNGNTTREMIDMQRLLLPQYTSELIPELFAFAGNNHEPGFCFVQVDTVRGGFGASAGSFAHDVTQAEMCELSIQIVEQLFLEYGTGDAR